MVFGYGSLVWKVDFPTVRSFPCKIRGFERRFWMKSCDHRGTPEAPGRVCTLVESVPELKGDGEVLGVAYEIPKANFKAILKDLDYRERHGYTRTVAKVTDLKGKVHDCQVYYNNVDGQAACVWGERPSDTAKIIAKAVGPSGPNIVYLRNLAEGIRRLKMGADPYLEELLAKAEGKGSKGK